MSYDFSIRASVLYFWWLIIVISGCDIVTAPDTSNPKRTYAEPAIAEKPLSASIQCAIDRLKEYGAEIGFEKRDSMRVPVSLNFKFVERHLDDDQLKTIEQLETLKSIYLSGVSTPKSDLKFLASLNELETLSLYKMEIANGGVERIGALKRLWFLDLHGCEFSGRGLLELGKLPKLKYLDIGGTAVTPRELEHVVKMIPELKSLSIHSTQIGDSDMKNIANLSQLETLSIADTDVTNDGLKHLHKLKRLKKLHVPRTKITDEGFLLLINIQSLEWVAIHDCDISVEAVKKLESMNPLLHIGYFQEKE